MRHIRAFAGLCLFVAIGVASRASSPPPGADRVTIWLEEMRAREHMNLLTPQDRALADRLLEKRITVAVDRVKAGTLAELLRDGIGESFRVDWKSLREAGLAEDTRVSFTAMNVSAVEALMQFADRLSEAASEPIRWEAWEGSVIIGPLQVLRPLTTLVVYDVRDLAIDKSDEARIARVNEIMDFIRQRVDPDGWRDLGGEVGTIQNLNGNLIISNTPRNHREIEVLLTELRQQGLVQVDVRATLLKSTMRLSQFEIGLPAIDHHRGGPVVAVVSADDAEDAISRLAEAPGTTLYSSPRLLVRSGSDATFSIEGDELIMLPLVGQEDVLVPVQLLDGAALAVNATAHDDRQHVNLALSARVAEIDDSMRPLRHRVAERSTELTLADGDAVILELPMSLQRVTGVRNHANPMTDTQTWEIVRQTDEQEAAGSVILVLRTSIVIPDPAGR